MFDLNSNLHILSVEMHGVYIDNKNVSVCKKMCIKSSLNETHAAIFRKTCLSI